MEVSGKVIQINPLQSGQGKNGEWKKQEFIIETKSQYPKKICITLWGDKIDQFSLSQGEDVVVSIDLESREFNGRWYTDVRAWKIEKQGDAGVSDVPAEDPGMGNDDMEINDLPF